MDAVSTIELGAYEVRVCRIADNLVEVDDVIERRLRTDPPVDIVPDPGLVRVPPGVRSGGRHIVTGNNRYPDDPDPFGFHPLNDRRHGRNQLACGRAAPNVVRSHEQYDVRHAVMGEHIAIEAFHSGWTVGWRRQPLARNRVAADPLVDHGFEALARTLRVKRVRIVL